MYREWDLTNDQLKCELNSGRYFFKQISRKIIMRKI